MPSKDAGGINLEKEIKIMAMSTVQLTAGMRQNLMALQRTSNDMETTQSRLATGLKIQSALDDPINYFAAKGHRDRAGDLAYRKEEMTEAVQLLKAADTGISALTDLIASAKSLAQSALSAESTSSINSLETQYNAVMTQIDDLASDSGYKGINLLAGTSETLDVYFDEDGVSKITLSGMDGFSSGLGMTTSIAANVWNSTSSGGVADRTDIEAAIDRLDSARTSLRSSAKTFSNNMSTITIRQDFTSNMINVLEDGAASLTEADLNEEGANMLMLQTRQALGTTSLSMASPAAQSVMRLF
jgi:flagellin-like hook-associated protein FlgL